MATAGPQEDRPQAGPVPTKRGEIGYQENVPGVPEHGESSGSNSPVESLPDRHPADTPPPSTVPGAPTSGSTTAAENNASNRSTPSAATPASGASPSSASVHSTSKLSSFFNSKRIPTFGGLRLTTIAIFLLQISVLGGTIAGWIILIQHMQASQSSSNGNNGGGDSNSSSDSSFSMGSALIFVYVAFGVMTLVQVIFLERTTFRLRAERYAHVHPGEILPRHRNERRARTGLAFVPWNRLSLPNYAAALAQSGVGTGDVEDNAIAVPPPPAYGDTRASTLLLAGAVPDRMRRVRTSASSGSSMSWTEVVMPHGGGDGGAQPDSRPVSYMSRDLAWEERLDADAAARLEESLAKMEEGDVTDGDAPRQETH